MKEIVVIYLAAAFGVGWVNCECRGDTSFCLGTFQGKAAGFELGYIEESWVEVFNKVCNVHLPELKTCFEGCPRTAPGRYDRYIRIFDYLCDEVKEVAIEHGECLAQENVKKAVRECYEFTEFTLGDPGCDETESMLSCIQKAAADECGQEAGKYMRAFELRSIEPAELEGCDMDKLAGADRVMVGWTVGLALIFQLLVVYFVC